jgi:hypothetical protein
MKHQDVDSTLVFCRKGEREIMQSNYLVGTGFYLEVIKMF